MVKDCRGRQVDIECSCLLHTSKDQRDEVFARLSDSRAIAAAAGVWFTEELLADLLTALPRNGRRPLRQLRSHRADGEVRVFDQAPGVVARCPACDQVLLRVVRGPGRAWLDMRGLTYLQLPVPTRPERHRWATRAEPGPASPPGLARQRH